MYIIRRMLYTMQDDGELYGGARRRAPEPSPAQLKAEKFKKQIRENDVKSLDEYMEFGRERANRDVDTMLEIVRKHMEKTLATGSQDLGLFLAEEVAKTVTRDTVKEWLKRRLQRTAQEKEEREVAHRSAKWEGKPKEEIIKEAFELSRGSLAATLKRARLLTSQKITMDDVKKWRLENTNKEKKTN